MKTDNPLCERLLVARRKTLAMWIRRRDVKIAIRDDADGAVKRAVKAIENVNDEIEMLLEPENNRGEEK